MNLVDAIECQARAQPQAVALISGRRVVRYGQLIAIVRRVAAMLAARGLAAGNVVGIHMVNTPLHLVVMLALARMNAISVSVHPLLSPERKKMVVDEYQVTAVVAGQPKVAVEGVPWIHADESWLEPGKGAGGWRRGAESGDLPFRIGLSSGTTGRPKGVLRTHDQTLNLVLLQRTVIDIGPNARFLVAMDLNLTANVLRLLRHLLGGNAIVFPRSMRDLDSILDAINRHAVTHALLSPDIVGKWVQWLPEHRLHAPGLLHLAIAGGRMSPALREAIIERLTPNVFTSYGNTETGTMAVGDVEMHRRNPGSVGRVVPWARAQVVDEQDRPLPAGQAGILRFRSIGAADGYYRNPAASAKTFRDGWVYPGDIARLLPDGILVIESRADDIINLGGVKVDPAGIEDALVRHPDVVEAAVFAAKADDGRDRLYAAVVLRGAVDERVLIQHCKDIVGQPVPHRISAVRELPRNLMGKLVRHELVACVKREGRPAGAAHGEAGSDQGEVPN